jgi:gamma-glutamyltranspeptidase / glutathione hydrolase
MDHTQSQWVIEKRQARADHAMVTAMHPLAAAAGLEILRAGGNAVDAAVATGFAVGVVEPAMSGLGGVAAMVIYSAADGAVRVVDGASAAPAAARDGMFELVQGPARAGIYGWPGTVGDAQNTGYRAPVVPGQPACLLHALDRYGSGRLGRARVMAPAIRLAEEGFPLDTYQAQTIAFAQRRLRQFPETLRTFYADGAAPRPASLSYEADHLVQPDLARSLRQLAEQGPDALYQGELGERIAADLQANGGILTRADFADYRVREYTPGLETSYRGYRLMGLSPASGSMTAFEALNILGHFDLRALGEGSAEARHVIAEACRRAFLDRFAHLADPAQQQVPVEGLLSPGYAERLAASINLDRAEPDAQPGDPWSYEPHATSPSSVAQVARVPGADGCTTHLNVVDADGNGVALTSTLGEAFGSGVVAKGTGILLNNGLTWFDPEPGHVNSIQPRKRILWAPTPTIVLRDGRPILALGAPGGRRIISAMVQSLVNLLDFGLDVQTAVTTPRVHCEGPVTEADARLPAPVLDALAARGHRLKVVEENSSSFRFARPCGIQLDPRTGGLTGGVHQFTPAWAMGY